MTEKNSNWKVSFLGRHKKYGKWEKYSIEVPAELEDKEVRDKCIEHVQSETKSEYVEVQIIHKTKIK
jgi:hypothetical protein